MNNLFYGFQDIASDAASGFQGGDPQKMTASLDTISSGIGAGITGIDALKVSPSVPELAPLKAQLQQALLELQDVIAQARSAVQSGNLAAFAQLAQKQQAIGNGLLPTLASEYSLIAKYRISSDGVGFRGTPVRVEGISMEPALKAGSQAYYRNDPFTALKTRDVIVFKDPQGPLVVKRIVSVNSDHSLTLQGDSTPSASPRQVTEDMYQGKIVSICQQVTTPIEVLGQKVYTDCSIRYSVNPP